MKFGTGSNAERTQKYGGSKYKMTYVRPNNWRASVASETVLENARVALVGRARFWGNVDTFNCIGVV